MARKPNLYTHITKHLPRLPGIEPERADLVRQVKEEILATTAEGDTTPHGDYVRHLVREAEAEMGNAINLTKRLLAGKRTGGDLVKAYAHIRAIKGSLAALTASCNVVIDAYETLMVDQLEIEGVSFLRTEAGSVQVREEPYASVVDKVLYREWCIQNGYAGELQMHSSRTTSLVKELLLEGKAEPPGVKVSANRSVYFTPA